MITPAIVLSLAIAACGSTRSSENETSASKEKQEISMVTGPVIVDDPVLSRMYGDTNLYFGVGEAAIDRKKEALLDEIASALLKNQDVETVSIIGHSSGIDAETKEEKLSTSRQRAEAVAEYLKGKGVHEDRLRVYFFSDHCQGKLDNDSSQKVALLITLHRIHGNELEITCETKEFWKFYYSAEGKRQFDKDLVETKKRPPEIPPNR